MSEEGTNRVLNLSDIVFWTAICVGLSVATIYYGLASSTAEIALVAGVCGLVVGSGLTLIAEGGYI